MSKWIEVALTVDGEAAEATAELLQRYGYQGVAVEHEGIPPDKLDEDELPPPTMFTVRAYLPFNDQVDDMRQKLEMALGYMNLMYPMPQPVYRQVDEQDWADAWKVHYHPVKIGRHIMIRPLWVEMEIAPEDVEIALDPGMAFGTGTHPTTQLCLEALEDLTKPNMSVLDLGCGSGILAIGAAKLGASPVIGIDNDAVAVESALMNIEQNGVADKIEVREGSLANVVESGETFDLIVVNILARIIIAMCSQGLGDTVKQGGLAIFSGIIDTQADDVEAALRTTGLEPYHRRLQGDWVVIEARKP